MIANWKDVVVSPDAPLDVAIGKIDASSLQIALVLNPDNTLAGVLTDGDIRRAILDGKSLKIPVAEAMNRHPTTGLTSMPRDDMLRLMRQKVFHHLPLVDGAGHVVGLVTLDELIGAAKRPNWVVLMAGGRGTRLQPLTNERPKPLLAVGGKPILENIIESFLEQGFQQFFLAVNYKAELIREHFGDGAHWGARISYLEERVRLGTAGALSLLPQKPDLPLIVMNGDLLTRASFQGMLDFHAQHGAAATMGVREYDFQVPYGVVHVDGPTIRQIEEKPVQRHFINAGIYVLSPRVLSGIPRNEFFDMPTLFERLIAAGDSTAAYPINEYWLDIGRMTDFERAQLDYSALLDDDAADR